MSQLSSLLRRLKGSTRKRLRAAQKRIRDLSSRDGKLVISKRLARIFAETTRVGSSSIYCSEPPVNCDVLKFPSSTHPNAGSEQLKSSLCTRHQLASPAFRYWAEQMQEDWRLHRKLWEFCFILQALSERGMLEEGRKGLGFAVGEEPLPALMAKLGCEILASDLDSNDERAGVWAETAQLASTLEGLNARAICNAGDFNRRVSFQPIDMNRIPSNVHGYDFSWSSCSFEHCGSIELGKRFLREQMRCLKPGGIAVHTTEFNLSSLDETIETGTTVIFRRRDIESMIRDLQADGHHVEPLQLDLGMSEEDGQVDLFPYSDNVHLKLELFDRYVSTSIGLIIRKSGSLGAGEQLRPLAA